MRKKISGLAEKYLTSEGFTTLYPPQKACVQAGLLDGKSLLVSAPTASGKTLIAILAMISHISKRGGKVIYLSPLRALAAEKFAEFKKLEKLDFGRKIRVSVSTGDFDGRDRNLAKSDILILTNEKMDSIIRHRAEWIDEIGLIIADEVHLIGDETRGPTLEMVLTQLKTSGNDLQIVGLSATVTNSDIISDWLGCKLIKTDWRPVPLFEGVTDGNHIIMNNGDTFEFKKTKNGTPIDLGVQSVAEGGQSLIFAETRARSKSLATKAASVVYDLLGDIELDKLAKISAKVLRENEQTDMVKTLSTLLKSGVAFHHAGLNQNCRSVVEEEFKRGTIKILSSTPTLAAGVNLPARRVVISRVTRYDAREGRNMPISVMEYKQLCGRAGRPQFDEYGQAIVVGNDNAEDIIERYIDGTPEPIISKLTDDHSLRIHILSVVVTHPGIKKDDLLGFFLQTLGGVQSSKASVKFAISISLRFLTNQDMVVVKGDRYAATEFGQKTSMLYLDPYTATNFKKAILSASKKRKHTLGFLHVITSAEEFFPKFYMRNADYENASHIIERHSGELFEHISEYDCSRSLIALYHWIAESSELSLSENFGIESGDMHRMMENADRLVYCMREIAKHAERADLLDELDLLRMRLKYGIKEELLDLVKLKGIGRVRARALYRHKICNLEDLEKVPVKKLAGIDKIGATLAGKIKVELRRTRH